MAKETKHLDTKHLTFATEVEVREVFGEDFAHEIEKQSQSLIDNLEHAVYEIACKITLGEFKDGIGRKMGPSGLAGILLGAVIVDMGKTFIGMGMDQKTVQHFFSVVHKFTSDDMADILIKILEHDKKGMN